MAQLNTDLETIKTARDNMKTALEGQGQTVTKDIRTYAQAIANISGGSGDVKLFETVEEMQEDENPQKGDLAVVYREEIQAVTEESEFDNCIFPNTVVLEEAFSDNVYGRFRSTGSGFFDGMVDMSSSSFRFDGYGDSSEIRVQYESQDGITYTRTDGGDELQEFGTTIQWDDGMGSFNSVVGNFMKIGGNYFEGIYKCNEVINYGKVKPIIITDKNTISDDVNYFNIDTIKNVFDNNLENFIENCSYLTSRIKSSSAYQTYGYKAIYYYWRYFVWVLNNDNTADLYCYFSNTDGYISPFVYYNDITYLGASDNNISGTSSITLKITINLVNETMTWEDMATTVNQYKTSGNHGVLIPFNFENKKIVAYYLRPDNSNWNYTSISYNTYNATSNYISTGLTQNLTTITSHSLDYKLELIYEYANTQLDATLDYVYEKTFYGKNGVETGNLQNTQNVDINKLQIKTTVYNSLANLTLSPSITSLSNTFRQMTNITTIPFIDTSNVTDMQIMFYYCTSLQTIPLLDTSNVTNMYRMFIGSELLTSIPQLDTSNVTNMGGMFIQCYVLTSIPQLDTSNVTDMGEMFEQCSSLTSVPQLNTSNVTNMYHMFSSCPSLSNESLNNILYMCANATAYINQGTNMTLKYIGLTSEQATICQGLSNYSAFTSAGWTTGY